MNEEKTQIADGVVSRLNAELGVFKFNDEFEVNMILYRPKLQEKGCAKYLENSFEYGFQTLFKTKEEAITYTENWLEFKYSQDFVTFPPREDLEIVLEEFVFNDKNI